MSTVLSKKHYYFVSWKNAAGVVAPVDPEGQWWAREDKARKHAVKMNSLMERRASGKEGYVVVKVTGQWSQEEV